MRSDDAERLRELERENVRLKRVVADQVLEIHGLKEISKKDCYARRAGARRSACCRRASSCRNGGPA